MNGQKEKVFANNNNNSKTCDFSNIVHHIAHFFVKCAQLHKRCGSASRSRLARASFKPPKAALVKRQVIGREVVVAVTNGKLDFGTWERIFCGEFDGAGANADWLKSLAIKCNSLFN